MKVPFHPPSPIQPYGSSPTTGPASKADCREQVGAFQQLLQENIGAKESSLNFSRHAQERLQDREIALTSDDLSRLERATDKAAAKGAHTGLMMMGNLNLIVSVQNRTVVTAMENN
ncbi:MAG: TIGR02530 family flagellar biosynthesis protein, partial [Planctomycetota bacterium]